MAWAQSIDFWHWWVLAVVLVILEIISPAAFFLWIGAAAVLVGGLIFVFPGIGWEMQLTAFAVLSVLAVLVGRQLFRPGATASDQPALNRRGEQYVGRLFTLDEPISNGRGKIRVDDSTWKIRGADCAAGSHVRVTGVDGVVLLVEEVG
jgi:hypothetical protein